MKKKDKVAKMRRKKVPFEFSIRPGYCYNEHMIKDICL